VTPPEPSPLVGLTTHARLVPAVERERFAARLRERLGPGSLILETCHRVEAYTTVATDAAALAAAVELPSGGVLLTGDEAARHAATLAVGGDSVVVGEDQILHQLRAAVDAARAAGGLDPTLDRLFSIALQAGRRARSWQQGPRRSLGDLAAEAIGRRRGPLDGQAVLVVGAGQMGRLAVRAARARGAAVAVANRSAAGAERLAGSVAGRTEAFDPGDGAAAYSGIIVALAGPWPIGGRTVASLAGAATVVVDLSVPAAVPAAASAALGSRFITADDLATGEPDAADEAAVARVRPLVDRAVAEFDDWRSGHDGRAAARALAHRAERERAVELAALWHRLPDLDPASREAIERMTEHLASRLLREPLERLGRDRDGRAARAIRDVFAL
jgi:glutamyl-tRNA reductase